MDRDTGPAYYYAKDDLIKPTVPGFLIVLPELNPLKELQQMDTRLPLDLHYSAVLKRVEGGLINPVPKNVPDLTEDLIEAMKLVATYNFRGLVLTIQTTTQCSSEPTSWEAKWPL